MSEPTSLTPAREPRRLAHVKMSVEFLSDYCHQDADHDWRASWRVKSGLPTSARLVGFFLDLEAEHLVLRFENESFELVPDGGLIPTINVILETRR